MVFLLELFEGANSPIEIIRTVAIFIAVLLAAISFYFSKFQGAKVRAIEVQEQTPLSTAHHTVIFTNYGNKTGVVLGPGIVSGEKANASETEGRTVLAIEPKDTVISKVDVDTTVEIDFMYHLEYKDVTGKLIKLPNHTYYGKTKSSGKSETPKSTE